MSGKSQGFQNRLWGSFPSGQGEDKERVLTVGSQVGQQHAEVLNHLRVILVELVHILEEVKATAALFHYHHLEGHQFWGREAREFGFLVQFSVVPLQLPFSAPCAQCPWEGAL